MQINQNKWNFLVFSVADPGFPIGGCGPRRGAMYPQGGYVLKILHVKMKEFGPVGGGGHMLGMPPRSANGFGHKLGTNLYLFQF